MIGTDAPDEARPTGSSGVRVLVVDDSPDHRTLMQRRLRQADYVVHTAGTAEEAHARLADVDLVLLDYRMPGTSGIDLLADIGTLPQPPSVVMVSGAGSTDVAVEAMRLGAIDYLGKDAGYLDRLPDIVHRAWRHHDLSRRTADLHRLALLVASAQDRDHLIDEILHGADRLLRATGMVLFVDEGGSLRRERVRGDVPDRVTDLAGANSQSICGDGTPRFEGDRLLVPMPRGDGTCVGLLVAWTDAVRQRHEELELAAVFASFAGVALRNVQQRELEADLLAEMQQTVEARRNFITSVSHELRTPMTSISGFAATLVDHWDELGVEQRHDMLHRVRRNADDLRALVEEMVDLAALDRGQALRVETSPLDLGEQLEEVLADAEEFLGERDVTLDAPLVTVTADAVLLRRVMVNLLTNAVKYSPDTAPIAVRALVSDDAATVEVEDRGPGLQPRVAARVFDPFFRERAAISNAVRGTGIGLALVKEYVRLMGGEVGVDSTPGHGSTFWFTLPVDGQGPGLGAAGRVVTLDDPDAGWSSSVSSPGS